MYSLLTLLFVLFFSGSTLLVQCGGKKKGATSAEGKSSTMGPAPGGAPAAASAQGEPKIMAAAAGFNWDDADVKKRWDAFTKFGAATATEMTGKNFDKWLKDAGVLDNKAITGTMTGIAFSKVTGPKKKATFDETKKVLAFVAEDRARQSKKPIQDELDAITEKLAKLEAPSVGGAAKANAAGVYSRLTDHTKYTGAHKERFDAEGKGKGKSGRADTTENTGYVGAYKNKDSYDKTHGK